MDILSRIFGPDKEDLKRSHLKNLVSIALADGHLADDEWELLLYLGSRLGMNEAEITAIKENPESVRFVMPGTHEERVQQIEDLVLVMSIDRDIDPDEIELCKKIALKLDVLPQLVDSIIQANRGIKE
ncbi:MAG TPA: hypothetical protein PLJ60_17045 [Chryseolinea sp.]|nr:hypothetical protein [Chryseolinea sp.]HPM32042.1 hypothetical protein [Chryseolinea sp.]